MSTSFENDLLISYAHLDDQALLDGQPGWVSSLHRILEVRVGQFLGEKPRIWRAPELAGNDDFEEVILDQLPKAAALLAVLSPRYVQSEWCNRELQEFCRAAMESEGLKIGHKSRLFKVVKTPVPLERHPEPLQTLLGYDFYVLDPETRRPREFSPQQLYGLEVQQRFMARLDDLAYDIKLLLERLDGEGALPQPVKPLKTVYLAETSFDRGEDREAVKRDLVRNGYEVLPDRPLPLVAGELVAFVEEQLARSTLSIHLIGKGYGVVPDGSAHSIVALQHDVAERRSAAGELPRLIWIPPGLKTKDNRQKKLLHHLRTAPAAHTRAELLEGSLEDLKSAIHRRLAPPPETASRPLQPAGNAQAGPLRIYVVCDPQDLDAVRPLRDHPLRPRLRGRAAAVRQGRRRGPDPAGPRG